MTSSPPIALPPAATTKKSYCKIERTSSKTKTLLQQTKKVITTVKEHIIPQTKI